MCRQQLFFHLFVLIAGKCWNQAWQPSRYPKKNISTEVRFTELSGKQNSLTPKFSLQESPATKFSVQNRKVDFFGYPDFHLFWNVFRICGVMSLCVGGLWICLPRATFLLNVDPDRYAISMCWIVLEYMWIPLCIRSSASGVAGPRAFCSDSITPCNSLWSDRYGTAASQGRFDGEDAHDIATFHKSSYGKKKIYQCLAPKFCFQKKSGSQDPFTKRFDIQALFENGLTRKFCEQSGLATNIYSGFHTVIPAT